MYARRVDDRTLTFIVSGRLWRNSLVMRDRETGSDWSQITGSALSGPLTGRALEVMPSVQTTWAEWYGAHPGTKLLVKDEEIRSTRYAKYFADDRAGIFRVSWLVGRLDAKEKVFGLSRGPHALAVTERHVIASDHVETDLWGETIRIERGADGGTRAFVVDERGREEIPIGLYFWFAWSSFYPNTALVGEPDPSPPRERRRR